MSFRNVQSDGWINAPTTILEHCDTGQWPRYVTKRLSNQPRIYWKLFAMVVASGIATCAFTPLSRAQGKVWSAVTSFHLLLWDIFTDKHSGHLSLCPLRIFISIISPPKLVSSRSWENEKQQSLAKRWKSSTNQPTTLMDSFVLSF